MDEAQIAALLFASPNGTVQSMLVSLESIDVSGFALEQSGEQVTHLGRGVACERGLAHALVLQFKFPAYKPHRAIAKSDNVIFTRGFRAPQLTCILAWHMRMLLFTVTWRVAVSIRSLENAKANCIYIHISGKSPRPRQAVVIRAGILGALEQRCSGAPISFEMKNFTS
jgi:hypothetical protein